MIWFFFIFIQEIFVMASRKELSDKVFSLDWFSGLFVENDIETGLLKFFGIPLRSNQEKSYLGFHIV
jgi:hypothetical protein